MYKKWIFTLLFAVFLIGCQSDDVVEKSPVNEDAVEETVNADEHNENNANNTNEQEEKQENNTENESSTNAEGALTVHYIDAGQGDATLLQYKDEEEQYTILYDAGDWLGSEVVPYLEKEGVDEIDIAIISHPHADHIGQLKRVVENFSVGEVWMSGNSASSDVFTEAMEAVDNSDASYEEPSTGDIFDVGPLVLTVLHPDQLSGDLNEDSLSIHFQFGETAFLFTGDAYKENEQEMIATDLPIEANVLQLGHHGSDTSSSSSFIDAVQPEIAVYSAGEDNSYGHPHEEVVSLFEEKGIPLYGTDKDGTIVITSDGETVEVESDEEPEEALHKPETNVENDNDNGENEQPDEKEQATESDKDDQNESTEGCIDINSASESELTNIKHIGEVRAQDIINMRPFDSVDDLIQVNGIGDKTLEDIKAENKACAKGA